MKKFLLALVAVAALTAGCACSPQAIQQAEQEAQQRYNNTWFKVTKFVGDKPVERWYVHEARYGRYDTECTIYFRGRYINLGSNVSVDDVSGMYDGREKHEVLEGYTE